MRVGVGLAVLVVDPVVAAPLEDGVFEGERLHAGQEEPERQLGLVGSVRPESVGAGGDADAAKHVEQVGAADGLPLGRDETLSEPYEGAEM